MMSFIWIAVGAAGVMAQVEPCGLRSQLTQLELHGAGLLVQEMNRPDTETELGTVPILQVGFSSPFRWRNR
jgi:hypothetical protein